MKRMLARIIQYGKSHPLHTIIAISLLMQFGFVALFGVMEWTDSPGYYYAGQLLAQGEFDTFRTPSYPLFFTIAGFISSSFKLWIVAAIQIIFFYFCIV